MVALLVALEIDRARQWGGVRVRCMVQQAIIRMAKIPLFVCSGEEFVFVRVSRPVPSSLFYVDQQQDWRDD